MSPVLLLAASIQRSVIFSLSIAVVRNLERP
jgi:hypothetical protein